MQQFVQNKSQKKKLSAETQSQLEVLRDAINKIFQTKYSSLSFEELYRTAYTLVIGRFGDSLYEEVKNAISANLRAMVQQMKTTNESGVMLAVTKDVWAKFNIYLSVTNDILMYLDRNYITRNHLPSVLDLGFQTFKDVVLQRTGLIERLHQAMISEITKDRNGEYVEKAAVKEAAAMLIRVGVNSSKVYEECFEQHFLEQTKQYYALEIQKSLAEMSCPEFLQNAECRLMQETVRCDRFLDKSTAPKLRDIMIDIFLRKPAKTLITMEASGLEKLIQYERIGDIDRMYRLFSQDPECKKLLLATFVQSIKSDGERLIKEHQLDEKKDTTKYVDTLIAMKEKYNKIWIDACKKDKEYELPFKQTFDTFINVDNCTAKALAGYCDDLLRERMRQMSEAELDHCLEKIIMVFRHVQSKDMFEEFYTYHLSRRLLAKKCVSDDAEKLMISKLKAECGNQYTLKLETMMKDIGTSQETMHMYEDEYEVPSSKSMKLDIRVLTQGNWPIESRVHLCNLPLELDDAKHSFTEFYMKRHNGRVLNWKLNMGEVDVRAHIGAGGKVYEFTTTTYQSVILMLFNDNDELLFEDILQKTQIPETDLKKNFVSLLICKVLVRSNAVSAESAANVSMISKEIHESDAFRINDHFVSKYNRIRLPLISDKQVAVKQEPLQKLESSVEEDRGMLIDATIVKILKARKSAEHNDLIADVIKMTAGRFAAEPPNIKNRIESLIEKDFIERSKQDRRIYVYKA